MTQVLNAGAMPNRNTLPRGVPMPVRSSAKAGVVKPRRESQGAPRRTPRAHETLPFTLLSDPTPLIGRDRELEVLRHHLLGDSVRLLTVMGPGGVGKTRLALAAARSVEGAFPDGVWFIDLVPLKDPAHIDATIAQALGLEDVAPPSPRERVAAYLRTRRLLLVLDNFEHVLPAASRIAELLTTCPHLRVLVTSREPLNLRLEQRMPLQGLAVPDLARPTPETVAQSASGALFLERARLVQPDLAPPPEDARALAELLRRLDGMPLAIQITAARSNVLSPGAMLARLQGPALLSTEEARDVPARHHTLRDAIEWSYSLLDSGEQELFQQLGVFAGGWTLEAAEDIVQREEPGSPFWRTLASLVDKSLVQTEGAGGADRRYRMLETIREFALERLAASGDLDTARQRHAAYYLALAEQAEPELWGPEEQTWLGRMEQEHENFRAALRWAGERGDEHLSVGLAGALADFWWVHDHLREGRRWLEQALALSPNGPPRPRAKALAGAGTLAGTLGDYATARRLLQNGLELAETLHDAAATARALTRLSMVAMYEDDARGAQALLERSLALCREGQDLQWQALTLVWLGWAHILLGDLDRAEATLTESLDLCRTVGNTRLTVVVMSYLAVVKMNRRDHAGAARLAAAALTSAQEMGQSRSLWVAVATAALISGHHGDLNRTVRLLGAVDGWSEWTGDVLVFGPAVREARDEITARARHQMGDSAYHTAVGEGQALLADEAVDLARAALEPLTRSGPDQATAREDSRELLSDREQAVLRLIAEGLPNKQIATSLAIAERTVKTHVTSAMNKLGVDNRAHATVVAIRRGLL
jgi:predicted ATPase/DNA-binding CsgD family transcriptional regulator